MENEPIITQAIAAKLYKFSKENHCQIVKEIDESQLTLCQFEAESLANETGETVSRDVKVGDGKVFVEITIGDVIIRKIVANLADNYTFAPNQPKESEKEA